MRFDAWSGLIYSSYSTHDITSALRGKLLPEDNIMIIACNPNDYAGFAPPWVWDWINKYRTPMAGLGMVPPSTAQANPGNSLSKLLADALTNPLHRKSSTND
jgi:hypothetical protein